MIEIDIKANTIIALLECICQRRSQPLDDEDDICDKCGEKMRVIRTYRAEDY